MQIVPKTLFSTCSYEIDTYSKNICIIYEKFEAKTNSFEIKI